jgi:N-acetylated-alpha-linked acidic dipeptidase
LNYPRLISTVSALSLVAYGASAASLMGFTPEGGGAEQTLEARFDEALSSKDIRERLRDMASLPNQVGSPHDFANATKTQELFRSWGWDAHIETFSVLYPTPLKVEFDLLGPNGFSADLTEPPIPGDATTQRRENALPAYLVFGADGDVTAPLVYVNYGMPADYAELERLGVDVKGKIVVARYGAGWRGLKPKLAAEHGAVGAIIYSDPADDGFAQGLPYPAGAWRPDRGVQRGSILDMPVAPGDPTTPGYGSTQGAPRVAIKDAQTILKIPALPMAWGDAQRVLGALKGPVAPPRWRGALPITYRVGGDDTAKAHLVVRSDWSQKTLYDVIATLKGRATPDQWVIRGNHRDGWVYGASDPLSGHSAMLEEAKAIGTLVKNGWRPERTIVYASWDGEEPGLLGSTEWAESHAAELQKKAVVYINSDGTGRGFLEAQASYSLRSWLDETSAAVTDPETGVSVGARAAAKAVVEGLAPGAGEEARSRAAQTKGGALFVSGDLGSGSDYTPFVQHLGIASINFGFGGEGSSAGVYHSAYDTFEHFDRFGDPGFAYEVATAKIGGRLVLRAADAGTLPFEPMDLVESLNLQIGEVKRLAETQRKNDLEYNAATGNHFFNLAADPTLALRAPPPKDVTPTFDFAALDAALDRLRRSAKSFSDTPPSPARRNATLQHLEQSLLLPEGLPGRPWYRHAISAPGLLTGYGAKTLPAIREAIEDRRWPDVMQGLKATASALQAAAQTLDER